MKRLASLIPVWHCVAALLALCMITIPFAIYGHLVDKGPTWLGLNISWTMTLNYALIKHWVWGKAIVYTYGPLAFLSTRTGWGISRWAFVAFDLFIVVNFYFVFIDFLKNNADKFLAVAVLFCTMLVVKQCFGSDLSWIILFFIIYWMMKTFSDHRWPFFAILIVLTVLAFYIKMNTGLIGMVFLCGHFINLMAYKKISLVKLLACCIFFTLLIAISAWLLRVSIFNYTFGSSELIKGYNDVMYLDEPHPHMENNLYVLFAGMLLLFVSRLWWLLNEKKYSLIIYAIAGVVFIFLLQKQSVLRNDISHLYEYYSIAPLLLLCGFSENENPKPHLKYSLVIVLFALFFIAEFSPITESARRRFSGPLEYIKQLRDYNSIVYLNQQDKRHIPQPILNKISSKTVDIFPWDSEYALENKLNYAPRPVFQSFSVYTGALEQTNYESYVKKAPDIVIYDYDAIDNRYPFNDESLVNLFVVNNYTLTDTFTSNERQRLVLQRNTKTIPLKFTRHKTATFALKNEIATDQLNFMKLNVQYSFIGKLMAFVNRPPHVQISYMRQDGRWFSYKTSVELLKSGLFIGGLVTSNAEYLSLLNGKQPASIKKIKLEINPQYFKEHGQMDAWFVNCPKIRF